MDATKVCGAKPKSESKLRMLDGNKHVLENDLMS